MIHIRTGKKSRKRGIMKKLTIPCTDLQTSCFVLGNMRISGLSEEKLYELIRTALDLGINFFDHADIYGSGECEKHFGRVLEAHPELRSEMVIQTKCDIVTGEHGGPRYETTKDYIIRQARQSIENLKCGYLDFLLLHRPDPLMDPHEVADAFDELEKEGLVRHFGVSNFPSSKMRMLQKFVKQPLKINQIQLSAVHALPIDEDVFFDMNDERADSKSGHILDYALEEDILLQAWCPLQASWADGFFIDHPKYPELNRILDDLARKYEVSKTAIAAAWLLRLPQKIQVIAGTTNPEHLREMAKGADIRLTAQEWYDIYTSCHHPLP